MFFDLQRPLEFLVGVPKLTARFRLAHLIATHFNYGEDNLITAIRQFVPTQGKERRNILSSRLAPLRWLGTCALMRDRAGRSPCSRRRSREKLMSASLHVYGILSGP